MPCIFFDKNNYFSRKFALDLHERKNPNKSIWIHALSVGEVISTRPLIQSLKTKYPDKPIVLTVKTTQGMAIARQELASEVDDILFMPLDYRGAISKIVKAVNPSLLILIETDIWPGLISYLKDKNIKIILVNGRVSPRTFRGYKKLRFYFRHVLSDIELLLMQSELDSNRIKAIGVPSQKIKIAGNIKFDQKWNSMDKKEHEEWMTLLGIDPGAKVVVAGSTHEGEDETVLRAYKKLLRPFPELILIIAPRRLDRVDHIKSTGESLGLKIIKKTELFKNIRGSYNVLILNTIGELGRIYGLASISFVGGSLVPSGGHNLLEPASFGCPVLFGKHTHNFVLMSELLLEHGGGKRIDDPENLYIVLKELLSDPDRLEKMGEHSKTFVETNSGAVNRVIDYIGGYIAAN